METFFVVFNVPENRKVYNASRYIRGEAGNFYIYLITANDGTAPSWKELRHAFISHYYNPMAREEILRQKLTMVQFKGTQRMSEFCEKFREIEAQIYDMAFPDRLTRFLNKLPQQAALFIRNAAGDMKDMEDIYRLARQWSINVCSTVVLRRAHAPLAPRLLRFGNPRSKSSDSHSESAPESASESEEEDGKESDTEDDLDIVVQVDEMDMDQVTCSKCSNNGHFARYCKMGNRSSCSNHNSHQKCCFSKKQNTISHTVDDKGYHPVCRNKNKQYLDNYIRKTVFCL